ncbi:MAG: putative metal-binding motif-containing protein [Myxococcota bacterium]
MRSVESVAGLGILLTSVVIVPAARAADRTVGPSGDYATIQEAIDVAGPGDAIVIEAGDFTGPVLVDGMSSLEIRGAAAPDRTRLLSGATGPTLHLRDATDVTVRDLTVDGGDSFRSIDVDGVVDGSVVLERVTTRAGWPPDDGPDLGKGGGLRVGERQTVVLRDALVFDNFSTVDGGGIYALGTLRLERTRVANNAAFRGAGVSCGSGADCTLVDSTLEANLAGVGGGISAVDGARLDLLRVALCQNEARSAHGGGLVAADADASVRNAVFWANTAVEEGGGAQLIGGSAALVNNTWVGNRAELGGAALHVEEGAAAVVTNNLLQSNVTTGSGPGDAARSIVGPPDGLTGRNQLYWSNAPSNAWPGLLPDAVLDDPGLPPPSCVPTAWLAALDGPAIDAGDPAILDPDGSRSDTGASGGPEALRDQDADTFLDGLADCDDRYPEVFPGAVVVCNGVDDDCDGEIDADDPDLVVGEPLRLLFRDADGDGFGDADEAAPRCGPGRGWVDAAGDCDDDAAEVFPGAAEVCNGLDDDCDGVVDPGCAEPRAFLGGEACSGCAAPGVGGSLWQLAGLGLLWLGLRCHGRAAWPRSPGRVRAR